MTETNRQVRLRSRPEGIPEARHFEVTEEPLGPLAEGKIRVRNAYLSVDPAMRGWVVRRQMFWDGRGSELTEGLAHLGCEVMRPGCGAASGGAGWFVA